MTDMTPIRAVRARWPRLLKEPEACEYLSIGKSTLRDHGPKPKHLGRAVLYDIRDLDRWADRLDDQPLEESDRKEEAAHVEDAFFRRRAEKRGRAQP
ncbi:hypothetical protein MRBLMC3_002875 [Sphingobium sp. LMC3-1-1.1]|uniref:helix-turn-helix transcriptional regulator n=1 Tax=Sphingobium sp. LMC3-1-1.1 TaxID=3135241 RepID=UPI003445068B